MHISKCCSSISVVLLRKYVRVAYLRAKTRKRDLLLITQSLQPVASVNITARVRSIWYYHVDMFNDLPIATKLELCLAHAWRVRCMHFQEHPPNGSQDTAEKTHYCSCEVAVIMDQSEKNCLFSTACVKSARYELWEKSLKWKARCSWKVLCIPCPIHYTGQQNLTFFLFHEHQ